MTAFVLMVAAAVFLWIVTAYNRLVDIKARTFAAWREVETTLSRRSGLSTRLVQEMRGSGDNEAEQIQAITLAQAAEAQARAKARPTDGIVELAESGAKVASALSKLRIVAEHYSNIKSKGQIGQVLDELRAVEEKLALSREHYTQTAVTYNSMQRQFPGRLLARLARGELVQPWAAGETGPPSA